MRVKIIIDYLYVRDLSIVGYFHFFDHKSFISRPTLNVASAFGIYE